MSCLLLNFSNILNGWSLNGLRFCEALKLGYFWLKMTFLTNFKTFQNLNQLRYLKNSNAGNSFWPLSTFPFYLLRLYMQPEGRGKATKVDKNVAKWTKICRSTVSRLFKYNCNCNKILPIFSLAAILGLEKVSYQV